MKQPIRDLQTKFILLARCGFLLAGISSLLAKTGEILADLDELLSFFQVPAN
jgi:hypothetical protein